eukprot:1364499-Rhodomonas_salina.2
MSSSRKQGGKWPSRTGGLPAAVQANQAIEKPIKPVKPSSLVTASAIPTPMTTCPATLSANERKLSTTPGLCSQVVWCETEKRREEEIMGRRELIKETNE